MIDACYIYLLRVLIDSMALLVPFVIVTVFAIVCFFFLGQHLLKVAKNLFTLVGENLLKSVFPLDIS